MTRTSRGAGSLQRVGSSCIGITLCTVVVYSDRCNAVELGRVKKPKSCRIGTIDKVMAY